MNNWFVHSQALNGQAVSCLMSQLRSSIHNGWLKHFLLFRRYSCFLWCFLLLCRLSGTTGTIHVEIWILICVGILWFAYFGASVEWVSHLGIFESLVGSNFLLVLGSLFLLRLTFVLETTCKFTHWIRLLEWIVFRSIWNQIYLWKSKIPWDCSCFKSISVRNLTCSK